MNGAKECKKSCLRNKNRENFSRIRHDNFLFPFDPFRTKTVEPIKITTRDERIKIIEEAHYNLFKVTSENVMVDLLTDSGTGAMSSSQTSALITGDESYAGSKSFLNFEKAVKELTNFKFVYPVHQGRAAERILFHFLCEPNKFVLSNGLFDTTRGNIEHLGGVGIDLPIDESDDTQNTFEFKGNICIKKLKNELETRKNAVSFVMLTITCNNGGGQPVSLENIENTRTLCSQFNIPLVIDGCRFAENAYFIKQREEKFSKMSIREIVARIFSYADAMTMSAKKDGLAHTGGWIALNDSELVDKVEGLLTLTEGFKTYGGLAGRDLDAIAIGLKEVIDKNYLKHRIESCFYLGEKLQEVGVPIVLPVGGHAVFIDARKFLPDIESLQFPAHSLAIELFIEGGIRCVEIGSLMFGRKANGEEKAAKHELLRLALPRRVFNKNHFDYIAGIFHKISMNKKKIGGYKIVKEAKYLRHFNSELRPIGESEEE
jgi:tyrosine phenol-lyase